MQTVDRGALPQVYLTQGLAAGPAAITRPAVHQKFLTEIAWSPVGAHKVAQSRSSALNRSAEDTLDSLDQCLVAHQ